jgi:hypothetical protein
MAFLVGSALIFGGLLGSRYRVIVLVLALPIAFVLPCSLALLANATLLQAMAWAFLASAAVQFGFCAGGLTAAAYDQRVSASSSSHWRHRNG